MLACFGVMDKRIALRSVNELEVLRARLPEDRLAFGRHGKGYYEGRRQEKSFTENWSN
jgi:hypothetical protein